MARSAERLGIEISAYVDAGRYAEALPLARDLLDNQKQLFGTEDAETAHCLNTLGYLLTKTDQAALALKAHQEALGILSLEKNPDPREILRTLDFLALANWRSGQAAEAIPLLRRGLALARELYGNHDARTAESLGNLGRVLADRDDPVGSQDAFLEALRIVEAIDPDHPKRSRFLSGLGSAAKALGNYGSASEFYSEALQTNLAIFGVEHPEVAKDHNNLATVLSLLGELEEAEGHCEKALELNRKHLGARHLETANGLGCLGTVRESLGKFSSAEALYEEALSIHEEQLGPSHPKTAVSLTNLGHLLKELGDYRGAEELYRRALDIRKKKLGSRHSRTAASLNNLGAVYEGLGVLEKARTLYEEALEIRRQVLGSDHPRTAISLSNLGLVVAAMGEPVLALEMLTKALEIREKVYPPGHPEIATNLENLGSLFHFVRDWKRQLEYFERALELRIKFFGPGHLSVAHSYHNIGTTLLQLGDLNKGRWTLERAVQIREKSLGPGHPDTVSSLLSLAILENEVGNQHRALAITRSLSAASEAWLEPLFAFGSGADKRLLLRTQGGLTDWAVNLNLGASAQEPEAAHLALTLILQNKGRSLSETRFQNLRQKGTGDSVTVALWEELQALRQQQLTWMLRRAVTSDPDIVRNKLAELLDQVQEAEASLSRRNAAFRKERNLSVGSRAVQARLPPHSALLEFFAYDPLSIQNPAGPWGDSRYAVYVLRESGDPVAVDLGSVREIDQAVIAFREGLKRRFPEGGLYPLAEAIDILTVRKIEPFLSTAKHLFLAPDGILNLLPFAALVGPSGRYRVEDFELKYLTTGRDLLRAAVPQRAQQPPLVLGNPDFGPCSPGASRDGLPHCFDGLTGAAEEAREIGKIFGLDNAEILLGANATETALRKVQGPRILHLATHGFFLPDLPLPSPAGRPIDLLRDRAEETLPDAFLRAGLALSGYNRRHESRDTTQDGLLTALEILDLDLRGTELVTLSACDTGLGNLQNGRGVFGFRWALIFAGAENLMMTLWPVDDSATRDLLVSWYSQLNAGVPAAEALRKVQLAAMRGGPLPATKRVLSRGVRPVGESSTAALTHPYYWAGIVLIGGALRFSGDELK